MVVEVEAHYFGVHCSTAAAVCANVEDAGTRFGERKQYRLVEPR